MLTRQGISPPAEREERIVSFAQLSEVSLFFTEEGAGESTVLFIHGWTCDSHDWSWQLPAFGTRHRVIAPDLRGHGRSSTPEKGWDPRSLAHDLIELLDQLDVGPVVVVGHSLGGMVASAIAIERPDLVRAVVAVDPAYGVTGPVEDMIAGLFEIMRTNAVETAAAALAGMEGTETSDALRALHRRRTLGADPAVVAEVFNGMYEPVDQFGFRAASGQYLARRRCPVLAFHQSADTASWEQSIAQHPDSCTVVWEGIGHWLHQVRPDEFNAIVLDWIEGLPA